MGLIAAVIAGLLGWKFADFQPRYFGAMAILALGMALMAPLGNFVVPVADLFDPQSLLISAAINFALMAVPFAIGVLIARLQRR